MLTACTKRRLKILTALTAPVGLAAVLVPGVLIRQAAAGRTFDEVDALPHRRVGLVLGCAPQLADGRTNLFFIYRIRSAARLFRARKVDYLIVSGDNHAAGYDEPTAMKQALISAGVPAPMIYCDYAGLRTLDSVVRAREVFDQTSLTIISQEFHNQRAIYLAQHEGIDALGFNAHEVTSLEGLRINLRELFARMRTVLDVCLLGTRPRFLGPKITVGEPP